MSKGNGTAVVKTGRNLARLSDELYQLILLDIASGEPAYKAVKAHGVSMGKFWRGLSASSERTEQYERAKALGIERLAEEIVELSDEVRIGLKTTTKADGSIETVDGDMVERARLGIDARKWLLSKMVPKKYGDKTEIEHSGGVRIVAVRGADEGLL